jgi:hypothetical protein
LHGRGNFSRIVNAIYLRSYLFTDCHSISPSYVAACAANSITSFESR